MEMKVGYKQTDLGIIPEVWEVKSLQEVCAEKITYGIVQCGPHIENGIPYIRVSDMNSTELDVGGMLRTSHSIAASFSRSKVNEGDIVYALRGKLGEVRRVNLTVAGANLTQGTARISPKKWVSSAYLLWSLRSPSALRQVELEAKGSTFREITLANLRCIEIAIPPISEQHAIAEALSDTDALIESLDQLIVKKRRIKQGTMQELLTGKRRLPGFSGEWDMKQLSELAEIDPEQLGVNTRPDYEFNYISLEDVDAGSLRSHSLQLLHLAPSRARRKLRFDDILVSTVRPNLKSHLWFREESQNWVCSTGFSVIRPSGRWSNPGYIFAHLFAEGIAKQIETLLTGSNYPAINSRDVRRLRVPVPSVEEQTAIAAVLSDMDSELAALEPRLAKARQIKQGMMQELLTGRIRLI